MAEALQYHFGANTPAPSYSIHGSSQEGRSLAVFPSRARDDGSRCRFKTCCLSACRQHLSCSLFVLQFWLNFYQELLLLVSSSGRQVCPARAGSVASCTRTSSARWRGAGLATPSAFTLLALTAASGGAARTAAAGAQAPSRAELARGLADQLGRPKPKRRQKRKPRRKPSRQHRLHLRQQLLLQLHCFLCLRFPRHGATFLECMHGMLRSAAL